MTAEIVRSGPLNWAQTAVWNLIFWRHQGETFPLGRCVWRIDDGVSVATACAAWSAMVRRHEALRSVFGFDAAGRPEQRVIRAEDFDPPVHVAPVSEYEAFDAADHRLDLAGPLWSVTIFEEDGLARCAYLLVEHVLYDATGLQNWGRQLAELVVDPGREVEVTQPIDLANAEVSVDDAQVVRAVARYRDGLCRVAQIAVPATRQEGDHRYLRSSATFGGLTGKLDEIARECRSTPSAILVYVAGWLTARCTGQPVLPLDLLYGRHEGENTIACQMQHVYSFGEFGSQPPRIGIHSVYRSIILAFAHGRMPRSLAAKVRSVASVERGGDLKDPIVYNVVYEQGAALVGALAAESDGVVNEWSDSGKPFCNIVWITVSGDVIEVSFDVDGAMFTTADTAAMLADFPRVIARIHESPDTVLSDHPDWSTRQFALEDGMVRVGVDWVRPREVERLLAAIPGVQAATVEVDGDELIANVACADGLSYFDVHEQLLATLSDHTDVVAPARYRGIPAGEEAWHVRERAPIPPTSAAELALGEELRRTHGFTVDDVGLTYLTAGGDLDLAPAVVLGLAERGYRGLRSAMFTAPLTLRAMARSLTSECPNT